MAAFDLAREVDADGIELDVRFDGDRQVVVFHDDMLQRLPGAPGRMDEISATQRAGLRVHGKPIPLLAEVLHAYDLEINVEIKVSRVAGMNELVTAVARIIKDSGRADQILISSFDPFALVQAHLQLPDIALAYLFYHQQAFPLRKGWVGNWIGASAVHPEHTLVDDDSIHRWHRSGFPVNTYTVDDTAELERLRLGVDGVFTNDPAHALAVFAKL